MDELERRQALAAFLRTRREKLQPAAVGLVTHGRRRTPGLRREEVAELANIGVSWYTLLEQGRAVHPSRQVLQSLAAALRLNATEAKHLFLLAGEQPTHKPPEREQVGLPLLRVIENLDPFPALVIGRRWDALAWNRSADLLFRLHEPSPPYDHNVVWRYFVRNTRAIDPDWEQQARYLVAGLGADAARYPGDPAFADLINDLRRVSPEFGAWWDQHDVRDLPDGPRTMQHPRFGLLEFDHVTFQTSLTAGLRVKVYSATPETAAKLAQALANPT